MEEPNFTIPLADDEWWMFSNQSSGMALSKNTILAEKIHKERERVRRVTIGNQELSGIPQVLRVLVSVEGGTVQSIAAPANVRLEWYTFDHDDNKQLGGKYEPVLPEGSIREEDRVIAPPGWRWN
jgi:hypothetical protein